MTSHQPLIPSFPPATGQMQKGLVHILTRRFFIETNPIKIFLIVSLAINALLVTAQAQSQPPLPSQLRCEYREKPLGVDVARPRMSWVLESGQRGATQQAYQILVASSPEALAKDNSDLWDSGKVTSDSMNQIPYSGKALVSFQAVFWKVRIIDQAGKLSAWSVPATWTMGILNEADWQGAKWIGARSSRHRAAVRRRAAPTWRPAAATPSGARPEG